ncbi:MAG: OmpW family outer membrane protein [Pigmentiphaga sp.]|uniref:OmpW/AlkL family protein n=1 Tax=Pigmentiphaga sp. TaxID=1977564 RepID=UPI0029A0F315|nr:OmpW family outer membrane protein [Pigmentiphaga sp.]MDX3907763.1 OmpW family outer membrane protein [Pigmentiphaga sp.]
MKHRITLAVLGAAWAAVAQAQSAGSNVIGAGWFHLEPQDSSKPLTIVGPAAVAGQVPNTGASISNADTVALTYTRFFTDHVAAELVMGVPPRFKLDGEQALGPVGQLGSARQWSPAVVVKYFFGPPDRAFRPYVGAGLSYVWYSDVELSGNFQRALSTRFTGGANPGLRTEADVDSKWVPILNVGASYQINKNWGALLSVSYLPLKTTAHLKTYGTPLGTVESQSQFKINPIVGLLALTYRF